MDIIVNFVKSITIYILLSSMVLNLTDNKKYKKFVELICGLILVILIVNPLLSVFGYRGDLMSQIENYDILFNFSEPLEGAAGSEELRNKAIMEQYEESLRERTAEILENYGYELVSADFTVSGDVGAKDYGAIREMYVVAEKQAVSVGDDDDAVRIDRIEKIEIGSVSIKNRQPDRVATPEEIMLKNKLSDFYNVASDNINIIIQGESDGG